MRAGDPRVCDLIHRDAAGSLWMTPDGWVLLTNQNIGTLRSRGIDVNASYLLSIGSAGLLNLNLIGSYLLESSLANPLYGYDCVGYFGCGGGGQPDARWRHRATISWESGFHTVLSLGRRLIGPSTNGVTSPDPDLSAPYYIPYAEASDALELPAYNYFDFSVTYDVTKEIQLTVGVNNVLDKEPPLAIGIAGEGLGTGFSGTYDPWGRFIHASILFTF